METEFLKGVSPREYQKRIFETCRKKNCLVVLPTGLGKTLVALMLSIERLEKFPDEKILFLAPTRPLAEQHLRYFEKHLPELFADMQLFTGSVFAKERKKIWHNSNMIFSTPQCIANDLKNNLYNLSEVCLLIEDEAHRCLKNYDYNFIAKEYKEQARNPRILGLTASPGSEISRIKDICKNLSIEEVELRTRESLDVKGYLQELEFEKIMIDFPKELEEIRNALKILFNRYVEELRSRHVLFGNANKIELINLQKRISGTIGRGNKNWGYYLAASACAQAIKLQHALELLETQTLNGFHQYIKKLSEEARKEKSKGVVALVSSSEFNFISNKTSELMAKKFEHPKVQKLSELIKSEIEKNPMTKIIVFMQFRDTASLISKILNEIPEIKSKIFVGQTKKISGINSKENTGLNQKEQKKIISDFSNGDLNVLCATSIGEEGLDIPEVNAVIFYEPVASAIRKIQRAGRTARLMKGKIIVLVTKKTRDENFYYVSRSREKKMHSAIHDIREDLEKKSKKNHKQESMGKWF
ncbi:DEAD/DEAH box helicase family protein [Candidatus Pacearchaeota archaeon]|nr:DEAD/DEAH box helicase family protein [Candidatus Pacearchaeota archaeon]